MAKASKEAPAATVPTQEGTTETSAANTEKKPRPERIFQTSNDKFKELRKKESLLNGEFNRLGRKIKSLGLSEDSTNKILEVLKAEHEQRAQAIFNGTDVSAEAGAEMI